jgi:photosystem II stability/assembly factor-like uncharacterized protein
MLKNSFTLIIGMFCFSAVLMAQKQEDSGLNSSTVSGLKFRNIGPAWASGRIADFAVNPKNPSEYYVGVASGNVWKTTNNGITWSPIFDEYGTYSIGVVKIDPNNHNVIWVGTGENNHQRALGYGDGVYKSLDGGKSFKNLGLKDSRQIGGIVIDPRNSDIVFVACEGSVWGPGGDRGLYRTKNGGETWERVFNVSENTGVNNVVMDPSNPNIMYLTTEQRRRHHFGKISGGPESSVYKSTDGGKTWREIKKGLPSVHMGGMGIDVSPVDPNVVYLIIEAADNKGGFYRSTNKGESWERMSDYNSSGQYYNEIYCDPKDVNKVFSVETYSKYSLDGGKTWKNLGSRNRHVDDHALWINPNNTDHILIGGDGGIYESFDMGQHWDFKENLPITQYYRVAVDNSYPFYWVYGGTQDNNSMGGPSASIKSQGVANDEWIETLGGDGFWQAIDPTNPNIVYSEYQYGNAYRFDKRTGEKVGIKPRERKGEEAYKWNWDTPMFLSPHNPKRLYMAANKVFRSDDQGNTWEVISEDLTAQKDRDEFPIMDKYWSIDGAVQKHVSTSLWGTIVSMDESRLQEGLLYVGTDDGVFSVSENAGKTWRQIKTTGKTNPFGVPEYTYISDIQADKHDANVVYVTFQNIKRDDFKPYVFRSNDKGKTFISIAGDLPKDQSVHTIQQDHKKKELLFVGTEFGIYFSIDGGKKWIQLKGGIPTIAVRDIAIQERENDLVLATFGRGFYVLDNYAPLRELTDDLLKKDAHLFKIKDAKSYVQTRGRDNQGSTYYFAENPKYGATFTYYLKSAPKSAKAERQANEKKLFDKGEFIPQPSWRELQREGQEEKAHLIFTIYDADNNPIRTLTKAAGKGINQITWDLRYPSPYPTKTDSFDPTKNERSGWPVMPGTYSVKIELWHNDELKELVKPTKFKVVKLFEDELTEAQRNEVKSFNASIANMIRVSNGTEQLLKDLIGRVETIKQTAYGMNGMKPELLRDARDLGKRLEELNFKMNGVDARASWEEIPPAQMPITKRVSEVAYTRYSYSGSVTSTEKRSYEIVREEIQPILNELKKIVEQDLPKLERMLDENAAPWTPGRVPKWE